jgi:hypothetical protein
MENRQNGGSVQRNDQTRESLQSRLIERIHNKKIQNGANFTKKKLSNHLFSIQSQSNLVEDVLATEKLEGTKTRNKNWQHQKTTELKNSEPRIEGDLEKSQEEKSTERRQEKVG